MGLKVYRTVQDLLRDLDLDEIDLDFLFPYLIRFKEIHFNHETKVVIIDTKLLSERKNVNHMGVFYKIRIADETLPRLKSRVAETQKRL